MKDSLRIAITGGGAPQSPTLIRHLRENEDKVPVKIHAMDMDGEACGKYFADSFSQIPPADADHYTDGLMEVLEREKPDALLNVCSADVRIISKLKSRIEAMGIACICSDAEAIDIADNKYELYKCFQDVDGVPVPEFHAPKSLEEFVETAKAMGYPEREVCFKPHVSKGTRGFRILSERFDRRDLLLNHKPVSRYMTMGEFVSIFSDGRPFPDLLLMEVMVGEEIDAMTIAYQGQALLSTFKTRESHRWGVIDKGRHVQRDDLAAAISKIVEKVPLQFNISLQFIDGMLLEINPRTSTFIYQDDMNEPWLAVKLATGLCTPDDVRAAQANVQYGRRMIRYMDQIFVDPDGTWSQ